jgi:N-acetylglucosaminyl-diphospho-decaprenol L-rhamnosyltransferase
VNPVFSVIVLNYNGRAWIEPCLAALARQVDAPAFEVLFVDNASSDGSVDVVTGAFPAVRVVRNDGNLGFAAGNNAGARAARGTYLVFLNNDTVPADDWLQQLYRAHLEAPGRPLVTSRIVFLDRPDVVDSAGDGYLRAGGAYKHGHGASVRAFAQSQEVFGACGAAFSIARDLFERLGGFDERFFMVYEDVDLSYRARLLGHRCWYAAGATVRHAGSGTLGRASDAAVFYGQRNLEWTWIKNTPAPLLLQTLPAHVAYSIAGLAHYAATGRGFAAVRGKISALAGLLRVLQQRRTIQRTRTVEAAALSSLMERGWLARKRREKSASLDLSDHQDGGVA